MRVTLYKALGLLLLALMWSACAGKYDHMAQTVVHDTVVRVGLKHSHPFLAEYKRFLEIERSGKTELREIFPDTGGYAWVAIVNNCGRLEISDIGGEQFSSELMIGTTKREYLGRFDFDQQKIYSFIPASAEPREPQPPR